MEKKPLSLNACTCNCGGYILRIGMNEMHLKQETLNILLDKLKLAQQYPNSNEPTVKRIVNTSVSNNT